MGQSFDEKSQAGFDGYTSNSQVRQRNPDIFLNFELTDAEAIKQAKAISEQKIEAWIQKAFSSNKITEPEGWRLYRVLEIARRGNQYHLLNQLPDQSEDAPETSGQLEEFSMRAAVLPPHCATPRSRTGALTCCS